MPLKVLFIARNQFGYLLDYYYYCCNCPDDIKIDYVCFDAGKPVIPSPNPNVRVLAFSRKTKGLGKLWTRFRYLFAIYMRILFGGYDLVACKNFVGCSVIPRLARVPSIVDVRTGSVDRNEQKRHAENDRLREETSRFPHISTLCVGLAEKLRLPLEKVRIIPLGANIVPMPDRTYDSLRLLYVGAVGRGRHLDETLAGFKLFVERHPEIDAVYDVVGQSIFQADNDFLHNIVENDPVLKSRVFMRGYVHHKDLASYWEKANVGISYIPINDVFDAQPPTKTFEYIGIGVPVVATATTENKPIVNDANGALCQDNPEAFAEALETIWERRKQYRCRDIQATIGANTWDAICRDLFDYWRECAKKPESAK